MAELRAGGLAIIIYSRFPENIGKVVKTEKFIGICEPYDSNCWEVTALSNLKGTLYDMKEGDSGFAPAKALMAIEGDDFSHEKESENELQKA